MKQIDYIKIATIKIIRNKKNIFFLVIIVFFTILLIGSLTFKDNLNKYIESYINKNIAFRTLSVSTKQNVDDLGKEELLNIKYVDDVYSSAYDFCSVESDFANEKLNGNIDLTYLGKSIPSSIIGSTFNSDDKNVAIIPIQFYPDNSCYNLEMDKDYIIDGHQLLGKQFTITYYTYKMEGQYAVKDKKLTKSFKIIGLYDNKECMNSNNQIYVSSLDIHEIVSSSIPEGAGEISYYAFNVVVDNLNNVEYVMNRISELGFMTIEPKVEMDTQLVNIITISCDIITLISIIAIVIMIIFYIKKKILNESKSIAILRVCGYNKKIITKKYIIEISLICLIAYIIGVSMFILIYLLSKNMIFSSFTYFGYQIHLNILNFVFAFVIIVLFTSMISKYFINRKMNNRIINIIESEE